MNTADISIRHDREGRRFVAVVDGEDTDATLKYRFVDDSTIDYFSTFTPPALRGRGLAREIVTTALDYALANDLHVVPTCPYVAKVIDSDPEYRGLLA